MVRRAGIVLTIVMVGCLGLGTEIAQAAYKPPVVADAEIACGWTSGKMKFNPPLVNGGTTPTQVTFNGGLTCKSDNPDVPALPYGITTGKVSGKFSLPRNACNFTVVSETDGGPGTAIIRWKGTQKIVPSTITTTTVEYRFGHNSGFGYPDFTLNPQADISGSFDTGGADFVGPARFDPPATSCGPKIKGVKGSGKGIKKLEMCPVDECGGAYFIN